MANARRTIQRAITTPSRTSGSFQAEALEQLWERCRLLFLTGLAISLVAEVLHLFLHSADPELTSGLVRFVWASGGVGHAASFLLALAALYVVRGSRGFLEGVALATIAFNLILGIYNAVAFSPANDVSFEVSLLLFLPAAFLPWRTGLQVALAGTALIWFAALHLLIYNFVPEVESFWAARGGVVAVRNHTIWGVTGIAILGGTSVLISRTLYTLRRTAHRARRLGNYLIHREIGKGGMGEVLFAQHALMCRPTAVKVMRTTDSEPQTSLARFEREIRVSATLTHPNTITIYDVGRTPDGCLYYAMEYLEGLDLQQLVDRFGPVSPARTIHILKQVCGSLAEAHSRKIVHRDIKPSNIFLTRRGGLYDFVKVLDFGLAKEIKADGAAGITKTGVLFGTPRYIAPEMVYGNETIDGRADLYALGGVMYWMLTGQPPFTSESSVEVVIDHVKTTPRRPSEVSEMKILTELEEIVMKCLEKRPADRFQNARELQAALSQVPVDEAWTDGRAEEWWNLHGLIDDDALEPECFFRDDEPREEERVSLVAAEPQA